MRLRQKSMAWSATLLGAMAVYYSFVQGSILNRLESDFVTGTVIKEIGSIAHVSAHREPTPQERALAEIEPSYAIHVQVGTDIYRAVLDDVIGSHGNKTVDNFALAVEPGMNVRFPTTYTGGHFRALLNGFSWPGFDQNLEGILDPDDITILPNE